MHFILSLLIENRVELVQNEKTPNIPCFSPLEKTAVLQVVFNDDVSDSIKDKLHVLRVSGARKVCVDLLRVLLLVEIFKLGLNVAGRFVKLVGACEERVVREGRAAVVATGL